MTFNKGTIQRISDNAGGEGSRTFEQEEKEKRAAELALANIELAYQNEQKEQRAQELIIANQELAYQNEQKEQRAQELIIANKELAFQNELKEQRAQELADAVKDLEAFAYVSSHHLQEPLRKILSFVDRVLEREAPNLSERGKYDLQRIDVATTRMSQLIQDIYTYSRINVSEPLFEKINIGALLEEISQDLQSRYHKKEGIIEIAVEAEAIVIASQFEQALHQLLDNALKFSNPLVPPHVSVFGRLDRGQALGHPALSADTTYCFIEVKDNGMGFHPQYTERIFEIFQKLHTVEEYSGTGIGLAIVKKIMDRHKGYITATGEPGKGAAFRLYFPQENL